ncbi:MAG: hypothetical protein IT201_08155 [Thermoleophilia bacterium]|nr:hypothetical protein [Thermoleophilia bacterium]
MSPGTSPPGTLTVAALAAGAGIDADVLEQLLAESREQGIVEQVGDGWRLTAAAPLPRATFPRERPPGGTGVSDRLRHRGRGQP